MIDIINKFLLAGNKFMPEMHLRQPAVFNKNKKNLVLLKVLVYHLPKIDKEFKCLWRQEIQNTFTEMK